jgi:hypothetical protein
MSRSPSLALVSSCIVRPRIVLTALFVGVAGCSDEYWRNDDYALLAIDVRGNMSLYVDAGNGGFAGLVDPTVFSLGADERYIVVAQHPATDQFGEFDRRVTNYFVVKRLPGSALEREKGVRGPMTKEQFDQLSATLHLPPFTTTFDDLK